jgi:hypothetical protein
MAIVENLKATHAVSETMRGVDNRVRLVDDRVAEVIRGTQIIFNQSQKSYLNSESFRRKGSEGGHATNRHRCRSSQGSHTTNCH